MADILEGVAELSTSAPLSQAQTVGIVRHVQSEIRDVECHVQETQRDLQHTKDHVHRLKERQSATHEDVHTLQVEVADANLHFDKLEKQVGRILEAVSELQTSDDNTKEHLRKLAEAKKMTDTRLDVMSGHVAQVEQNFTSVQQVLETKITDDLKALGKSIENLS
jgi:chromosome segregation ATPase